jgi:hypothetical protein
VVAVLSWGRAILEIKGSATANVPEFVNGRADGPLVIGDMDEVIDRNEWHVGIRLASPPLALIVNASWSADRTGDRLPEVDKTCIDAKALPLSGRKLWLSVIENVAILYMTYIHKYIYIYIYIYLYIYMLISSIYTVQYSIVQYSTMI